MYFRKFLVPLVNASNSQIAYIIFNKFPEKEPYDNSSEKESYDN